jgi:hypothetical protein
VKPQQSSRLPDRAENQGLAQCMSEACIGSVCEPGMRSKDWKSLRSDENIQFCWIINKTKRGDITHIQRLTKHSALKDHLKQTESHCFDHVTKILREVEVQLSIICR